MIHPDNALQFDFLINKGDQDLEGSQKTEEYKKLVKYFLASLTIPDQDQWVNLSPYENDRIIKDDFGKTEMGRDLLAQDYLLKQITSSLIYPEDGLGRKFWDKVYERAWKEYHTTDIPVNTFNKVWIVPDQAYVYESGNTAYILKSHLKVMLEEDYLSLNKHNAIPSSGVAAIGSQVIREIILPELEKEVNEGKNFANLRQMYSGMILATWYKKALKESLLGKVYADKDKVKGVDQDPQANEIIYERYLKAFKKGVFNYIKDDVDRYSNEAIPRKYFSGGFNRVDPAMAGRSSDVTVVHDLAMLPDTMKAGIAEGLNAPMDQMTVDFQDSAMSSKDATKIWIEIHKIMPVNILIGDAKDKVERNISGAFKSLSPEIRKNKKDIKNLQDAIIPVLTPNKNYVAGIDALKLLKFFQSKGINVSDSLRFSIEEKDMDYLSWLMAARSPMARTSPDFLPQEFRKSLGSRAVREFGEEFVKSAEFEKLMASAVASSEHPEEGYFSDNIAIAENYYTETLATLRATFKSQPDKAMSAHTILILEDGNSFMKLFEEILLKGGYTVLEAMTPQDALRIWEADRARIDLILSDTNRPGGLWVQDVNHFLKEKTIPVIAASTDDRSGELWEGTTNIFFNKNNTYRDLLPKVREALHENPDKAMSAERPVIVLAEDDQWIRAEIKRLLGEEGFLVYTAEHRSVLGEVMDTVMREQGRISLLITDTTGWTQTVADNLKRTDTYFNIHIPVIGMSGYDKEYIENSWKAAGVPLKAAVPKPFDTHKFLLEIDQILPKEAGAIKDHAQTSDPYGGIDLNSANFDFQIKRDGAGVPLPLVRQDMEQIMKIEGFTPVIIEIKPALNIPVLNELHERFEN